MSLNCLVTRLYRVGRKRALTTEGFDGAEEVVILKSSGEARQDVPQLEPQRDLPSHPQLQPIIPKHSPSAGSLNQHANQHQQATFEGQFEKDVASFFVSLSSPLQRGSLPNWDAESGVQSLPTSVTPNLSGCTHPLLRAETLPYDPIISH